MCGPKGEGSSPDSEWRLANFGLNHENPTAFVLPMCGGGGGGGGCSPAYLVHRWVWAIYFVSILVVSLAQNEDGAKWLIWLTYWGYTLLTLNVILQALAASHHDYSARRTKAVDVTRSATMPVSYKVMWVLQNITIATAPIISVIYWTVVYTGQEVKVVMFTTHAMNIVYVTFDLLLTGIPIRLLHAYQPMTFGAIYALFSATYWALGGTNSAGESYIYSVLDYGGSPELAIAYNLVLVFLVVPLIMVIWWSVQKVKHRILASCRTRRRVVQITGSDNGGYANEAYSSTPQLASHVV